ncbi:ABC transporter ATP-binding protein [Euzebya tangerina]|uniref:ABC transporter ATP-binding protein n=1 Tax=Euzebya tangerina TaxID=591198 RepID=UPI000E3165DA|nr:ABC transporter ATP-binding protein [Euzebya tangerina]
MTVAGPLLDVRDLRVSFATPRGRVLALDGIELSVDPGEVLAVVGESGSGKSVSMLATMGLLPATAAVSGHIILAGESLLHASAKRMRAIRGRDMAMVFQDPMSSLNPVHSVGRQIGESLQLHTDLSRRERRTRVIDLLDRVGIPAAARRVDDHPHEFSGGMRQRAMIAMALACNPKLLIADEPTTALDVTVQRQIVELVRDLQAETGMSVVWITHDLGVVAELADRVSVLYGGRVMETGTAQQVYRGSGHPYTAGLLRSIPGLDGEVTGTLPEIPGSPEVVTEPHTGCAFVDRCPMADDACQSTPTELTPLAEDGHRTACLRHADIVRELRWAAPTTRSWTSRTEGPGVAIRDLSVHFDVRRGFLGSRSATVRAVDGVTLDVRPGRTLGVVGESGCGKTTLGRALVGLVEPTAGTITLNGVAVTSKPGPHRRGIQMIFQDPFSSMNPGARVIDVVAEPMRIHGLVEEDRIEESVIELLAAVGLPADAVSRYPHEFSGGQRQRIAVARAIAAQPDVIVCDEPVSALDVSVQAQIVNLLATVQIERGLGFLFIAHDLAVVRHISDDVAVMYLGQIVERAPRDQLYANPLHPYTVALLAAVPSPEPRAQDDEGEDGGRGEDTRLRGDLPSPLAPPSGCRFHTRCPLAVPGTCDVEVPTLRAITADRTVACHLVEPAGGTAVPQ